MSTVDEIKARLDIVDYINSVVPLKRAGRYHKACCPFHSEKTPSFMVSADKQSWHCYGSCGEGGDLFAFAMKYFGWDFTEALEKLGEQAGVEVKRQKNPRLEVLRNIVAAATAAYHRLLLEHPQADDIRQYLAGRGLTEDTIETFQLGWHPGGQQAMFDYLQRLDYKAQDIIRAGLAVKRDDQYFDRLRGRLIIPLLDNRGKPLALAGRRMDGKTEAKYINTPNTEIFERSRYVYGLSRNNQSADTMVIVEGYMDVMQAHQAGYLNVIAQLGTGLTSYQLELLKNNRCLIFALDGDGAGANAMQRELMQAITESRDLRLAFLPEGKDPDDIIRESVEGWPVLLAKAIPAADILIEQRCADVHPDTPILERESIARDLLPILTKAESDLYRRDNLQKLAGRLYFKIGDLARLVEAQPQQSEPQPESEPVRPAAKPRAVLEHFLIQAMIVHEDWHAEAIRAFRACDIPDLCAADFPNYTYLYRLFLQSQEQFDLSTTDFILGELETAGESFDIPEALDVKVGQFIEQCFRLRLTRLNDELAALKEVGDTTQMQSRIKEKAKILNRT